MTRKLPIGLVLLLAAVLVSQSYSVAEARQAQVRNVRTTGGLTAIDRVKKIDAMTWKNKVQENRFRPGPRRTYAR